MTPSRILDRSLNRTRGSETSLSAFSFLFSQIVQEEQKKVPSVQGLEERLASLGRSVGLRYFELWSWREKPAKRELSALSLLALIQSLLWKSLTGHAAESLEVSYSNPKEYMISDPLPLTNRFLSLPKELCSFNPAAFLAGVLEAILTAAGFPASVTAHETTPAPIATHSSSASSLDSHPGSNATSPTHATATPSTTTTTTTTAATATTTTTVTANATGQGKTVFLIRFETDPTLAMKSFS